MMKPVLFGAGQLVVHPTYLRKNDPETVAKDVEIFRESVPDDCTITLVHTNSGSRVLFEEDESTEGTLNGVVVQDDELGTLFHGARKGESTRDLLDTAVTWSVGERNARQLLGRGDGAYRDLRMSQMMKRLDDMDDAFDRHHREQGWVHRMCWKLFNLIDGPSRAARKERELRDKESQKALFEGLDIDPS